MRTSASCRTGPVLPRLPPERGWSLHFEHFWVKSRVQFPAAPLSSFVTEECLVVSMGEGVEFNNGLFRVYFHDGVEKTPSVGKVIPKEIRDAKQSILFRNEILEHVSAEEGFPREERLQSSDFLQALGGLLRFSSAAAAAFALPRLDPGGEVRCTAHLKWKSQNHSGDPFAGRKEASRLGTRAVHPKDLSAGALIDDHFKLAEIVQHGL